MIPAYLLRMVPCTDPAGKVPTRLQLSGSDPPLAIQFRMAVMRPSLLQVETRIPVPAGCQMPAYSEFGLRLQSISMLVTVSVNDPSWNECPSHQRHESCRAIGLKVGTE